MAELTFMGVPRGEIPWAPAIDYDKCDFCMECDDFCPHRVFERREGEVKLVVANPGNCVVFCRACAKTCGPDAISFPDKPATVALIKKLHAAGAEPLRAEQPPAELAGGEPSSAEAAGA